MTNSTQQRLAYRLALIACVFTLIVMALGAFTRLIDAGLGCPDWPGCYGHLTVPSKTAALQQIQQLFPATPMTAYKAWAEMIHRYCAGSLAILLLFISSLGFTVARQQKRYKLMIPSFALLLLLFYQPILGMWTVTLKLMPAIVSQHLLGGMLILSFLWWFRLLTTANQPTPMPVKASLTPWLKLGVVLLFMQIALGAWTSTNYAALSCSDFPYCQASQWFPHWSWHAFNVFNKIGLNYDGGLLPLAGKQTIQMVHRLGAFIVVGYWLALSAVVISQHQQAPELLKPLYLLIGLLTIQVGLGIGNVLLSLPVAIAVCHNLCAGLSLVTAIALNYRTQALPQTNPSLAEEGMLA